jgi:hypothetical protein
LADSPDTGYELRGLRKAVFEEKLARMFRDDPELLMQASPMLGTSFPGVVVLPRDGFEHFTDVLAYTTEQNGEPLFVLFSDLLAEVDRLMPDLVDGVRRATYFTQALVLYEHRRRVGGVTLDEDGRQREARDLAGRLHDARAAASAQVNALARIVDWYAGVRGHTAAAERARQRSAKLELLEWLPAALNRAPDGATAGELLAEARTIAEELEALRTAPRAERRLPGNDAILAALPDALSLLGAIEVDQATRDAWADSLDPDRSFGEYHFTVTTPVVFPAQHATLRRYVADTLAILRDQPLDRTGPVPAVRLRLLHGPITDPDGRKVTALARTEGTELVVYAMDAWGVLQVLIEALYVEWDGFVGEQRRVVAELVGRVAGRPYEPSRLHSHPRPWLSQRVLDEIDSRGWEESWRIIADHRAERDRVVALFANRPDWQRLVAVYLDQRYLAMLDRVAPTTFAKDALQPLIKSAKKSLDTAIDGLGLSRGDRNRIRHDVAEGMSKRWGKGGLTEENPYLPYVLGDQVASLAVESYLAGVVDAEALRISELVGIAVPLLYWASAAGPSQLKESVYLAGSLPDQIDVGDPLRDVLAAAFAKLVPEELHERLGVGTRQVHEISKYLDDQHLRLREQQIELADVARVAGTQDAPTGLSEEAGDAGRVDEIEGNPLHGPESGETNVGWAAAGGAAAAVALAGWLAGPAVAVAVVVASGVLVAVGVAGFGDPARRDRYRVETTARSDDFGGPVVTRGPRATLDSAGVGVVLLVDHQARSARGSGVGAGTCGVGACRRGGARRAGRRCGTDHGPCGGGQRRGCAGAGREGVGATRRPGGSGDEAVARRG